MSAPSAEVRAWLKEFAARDLTAEALRSRLLASAQADPAGVSRLSDALRGAMRERLFSREWGEALLAELATLAAHAPTLHRTAAHTRVEGRSPADDEGTAVSASRLVAESSAPAFAPGAILKNRFVLKEQIGAGGMGRVFAAIDRRKTEARDPNPWVAVKILNPQLAQQPTALIALQRESRKAQNLAHPNVATVFDFDRDGDTVFMTMELLRGRSLDRVLRESGRGMGREAALKILRGIAEGLAYAHRKAIVHSDLKPGNVFLQEDGVPKILDFGIARAVPEAAAAGPKDVFDPSSMGAYTEAYATVEMIAGADPHPADDVYALGLIAYELVGGVHPYRRCGAVRARQLGLKAAPLKALKRREWRVLERSLSFERKQRPRDATEFLKQLTGATPLQRGLIAAVLVLALFSAYSWIQSYVDAGPAVPFARLAPETQRQFELYMADGNQLWQFYRKEQNVLALQEAVEQYANAYALHPGNRQAVRALQRAADQVLSASAENPEQQREFARALAARSEYLAKYPPIVAVLN